MATNKKPITTTTSVASASMRPRRSVNSPTVQNFHLVWLDESIDKLNNDDCCNSITKLRQVVNTVNTFTDVDECIDFITDIERGPIFMMVNGSFCQIIAPVTQDISQISSLYIYSDNKAPYEDWAQQWPKVKGVYTDITSICEALKQAAHDCDHNAVSISFIKLTDKTSKENLDQLDQSFMYTQILKEIILTIDFEQQHIHEFLTYCREQFVGNTIELKNVDKIENEYRHHQPIWWYTYQCFLYSMLNRALRTMEVDLILKMGFFVRDLHNHIVELHAEQYGGYHHSDSFTVYRGQGLSQTDFHQLKKTEGGLLSFNNFLSTSKSRDVSLRFAQRTMVTSDLVGVLFVIKIDPSISGIPFANVINASCYKREEEILFSMHSIFRIGQVKQIDMNDRLWQVDLTLTADKDPQLHALTETMREETRGSTGWDRLGELMIKLGQFNKSEELFEILLKQTTNDREKAHFLHQLGSSKYGQGNYAEAVRFFENSIKMKQKILSPTHCDLATSYNHIGAVYYSTGEYSKARSYYEKALEIRQKTLPPNHPHLASSYNNIGTVYDNMGEFSKALSYYEKALEINQKTLPANHPHLASSYNNIGTVYDSMGEFSKALSYFEKALEINQKTLPANLSNLAASYNNIGNLYNRKGEYSKGLSYYEKSLEIQQKGLPANHPLFAIFYNNIGTMYDNMGEYSKALSYFGKVLEINQKALPAIHPHLAISYTNIGNVYNKMDKYSKTLSCFEKALEINQKTLSANHPDLATSYYNIGAVCYNMEEYSKVLSYYERALDIWQRSLPPNHSHLQMVRNHIEIVKKKL